MFCPLCKAEYREGFATCSDCGLKLVGTSAEANAIQTRMVWSGSRQKPLFRLNDELKDAGISYNVRTALAPRPKGFRLLMALIGGRTLFNPSPQWEVWVLESDFRLAQSFLDGSGKSGEQ